MIYLFDTNVVAEITTRRPPDPYAAAWVRIHKTLKRLGQTIDPPDALIAATAVANGWTLASRNVKHLARTGAQLINPWEYVPQSSHHSVGLLLLRDQDRCNHSSPVFFVRYRI